ncbi:YcnI family protein [uncultured Jatrophihabitans sp.]|uniref:YcnI family protein n=1 Tax=uncultured Jatrophihabitans sp. TaxID=1610747 RepID=UPI0035CB173C
MPKIIKTIVVALSAAALAFALAGPASAHVTVSSNTTAPGAEATLTFKVPSESDTASTIGLTVNLPIRDPFTSVQTEATPGWAVQTYTSKLAKPLKDDDGNTISSAVTKVVWTATSGGIKPEQFGTFALSVGPLPTTGTLYLPAEQHYSDGTNVNWVQQAQGTAEPEHPAPSVVVTPAAAAATSSGESDDGTAIGLGVAGIVLALLAGAVGGAAFSRSRRRPAPAPRSGADLTHAGV